MNGHKSSAYQVPNCLFTNQLSIRNCQKMTYCGQFRIKCCVKTVATLTLASTRVFLIKCAKNRTTISVLKQFFSSENELKFCYVKL